MYVSQRIFNSLLTLTCQNTACRLAYNTTSYNKNAQFFFCKVLFESITTKDDKTYEALQSKLFHEGCISWAR